jgi:hypothetical protein
VCNGWRSFHRRRGQRTTPTDDRILSFPPLPWSLRPARRTQRQESKSVAPRSRSSGRLPADTHCLFPGRCSPLHSAQSFVMRTLLAILPILSPTALEECIYAHSYRVSVCSTHRSLHAFPRNRSSCSPYSTDRIHNEWIFKARRKQVFSSYDTILPSLFVHVADTIQHTPGVKRANLLELRIHSESDLPPFILDLNLNQDHGNRPPALFLLRVAGYTVRQGPKSTITRSKHIRLSPTNRCTACFFVLAACKRMTPAPKL